MNGLSTQDLKILEHYAEEGNRELYWNYLAQKEGGDGYGLLALGVVRNDSMPGATANHFADNRARADGRVLSERDWEHFGEGLLSRDLTLRKAWLDRDRPDLALNLPVKDVQLAHDQAFKDARIDENAWTPRQLLEAARRQGGEPAAETVWHTMLDSRGLGLGRLGITSKDVVWTYNDDALPAMRYMGALTAASALAANDRDRTTPDVIGAKNFYYHHDARENAWYSISDGGPAGPLIQHVTDKKTLSELDDARAVRLESQAQRDDFHPQDPNRHRPIARSPRTLADAGTTQDNDARSGPLHASQHAHRTSPMSDHPLLQQALDAISRRDAELGRQPDEASQKIAVASAGLAARSGYTRIDDIVFNTATDQRAAGERFFVLQGGRDDPAHLRESMLTRDALALSPEQVKQQTTQLEMAQARTQEAPVQEHASRMPPPAGPHLG